MIRLINSIKPYAKCLLAAWIIIIICVSSIPSLPTLKIHTAKSVIRLDYLIHFCEYGLLALIAFLSFASDEYSLGYKKYLWISVSLITFAVLDEFHQKLIPGRAFNVKDILSNLTGIIAALMFCMIVFRKIAKSVIPDNNKDQ